MREADWQSEDGSIRLYRGDCLEVMPQLSETVDAIICDLPYGTTACKWDSVIPFEPLWASYKRVIKPSGAIVLFGSEPFSSHLRLSNIKEYKYDWVWAKCRPSNPMLAKKQPLKVHETVSVFADGSPAYYPRDLQPATKPRGGTRPSKTALGFGKNAVADYKQEWFGYPKSVIEVGTDNSKNVHPTQKPVALLEFLIRTYTNEGETVLDNTFGSGTAAVACINTGRKFIGIERDPDYFDVAVKRCEDALATRQGSLFPNDEPLIAV